MPFDFIGGGQSGGTTKWDFTGGQKQDVQLPGVGFDPEVSDPSLLMRAAYTPSAEAEVYTPEGGFIAPMSPGKALWQKGDAAKAAFQGLQVPYNLGFRGSPETEAIVTDKPTPSFTPQEMRQFQESMRPQSPIGKGLGFAAELGAMLPFYLAAEMGLGAPLAAGAGKGLGALSKAAPKLAPAIEKAAPYAESFMHGFGMGAPVETALGLGEGHSLPESLKSGITTGAAFGGFNVAAKGAGEFIKALRKVKPVEIAPKVELPTTPRKQGIDIPIDERTFENVGSRKVNAYQYDRPELKNYIQEEARRLQQELKDSVKGERYFGRDEGGNLNITGSKRVTSDSIARILDNTKSTYDDINKALQRIIDDLGAENQALAKRIELIIDDNLSGGFKTIDGMKIPPHQEYVAIKNKLEGKKSVPQEAWEATDDDIAELLRDTPSALRSPLPKQEGLMGEGSISAAKFTVPEKMAEVAPGQKVRSLGVSAMKADYTHPDTKAGLLMETYEGGAGTYKAITNKETIAKAQQMIAKGESGALRYARENPGTALSNTIELEMVKKANLENRFDDAIDIINEVSGRSTTQGQAIQSLRLWGNMTPEGVQKFYVKTIKNINSELEKKAGKAAKKLDIDPKIMAEINERMTKVGKMPDGRDKTIEVAKTLDLIAAQVPVPFLRKVALIQTMAQLLNPKTAIRNIGGNVGFMGLENVSNVLGAAIDKPLSLLTGQRTKVLPSLGAQAKGFKQGWKHGLEDALLGIDTSGMATKFDLPRGRVFRKGALGFAEKVLNVELRATDRAFYQAAYEGSLLNQMRAAKVNVPTEEMKNTAHLDGLYRTFQDDNALSKLFVGIKQALNKLTGSREFGAGDFIVKYPRTPANLLMRGLEYSPAGFVKTILEAAKPLAKQQFNQKAFVESFSRALVGSTTLFGTGALLHKLGVITGRRPEDWDLAELQRQQGFGEYRLNASALKRLVFGDGNTKPQKGDKIVSYDWFQPQAIPLAIGADIDANKGTNRGIAGTLVDALTTGVSAFAEQPVVQGLQTLFSGGYGDWSKGIVRVLETVPSSFVPTLFSQVRQLVDNQRRETYSPDKGQEAINRVTAKIPGLAAALPKKYGTLGQPLETYQDGGNNPFNVFLNPAFINTYNPSKEVQRVFDLYSQTGETKQVPRVAAKSITVSGKKFTLSGKERSDYQRLLGEYTQQGFAKMPGNLKPEAAVKRMQKIMTDANTKAKTEILKARGERVVKKGSGIAIK